MTNNIITRNLDTLDELIGSLTNNLSIKEIRNNSRNKRWIHNIVKNNLAKIALTLALQQVTKTSIFNYFDLE